MNKAAHALGRLARGVPKNYSAEEIARRSKILSVINARKRAIQLDQESCGGFESEMAALEAGRAAAMKSIEIQMAEASKEFDAAHLAACADIFTV